MAIASDVAAGVYQLPFDWDGVTSATASALLSQSFTIPDDDQELLVMGGAVSGDAGDYSLTLTGPLVAPISISATTTTDPEQIGHYLPEAGTVGDKNPLQVLLRGATYTLTVSAPATGTNRVRAFLLLRNRPRRR